MQRLEVSGVVRPIYGSLGVKRLKLRMSGAIPHSLTFLLGVQRGNITYTFTFTLQLTYRPCTIFMENLGTARGQRPNQRRSYVFGGPGRVIKMTAPIRIHDFWRPRPSNQNDRPIRIHDFWRPRPNNQNDRPIRIHELKKSPSFIAIPFIWLNNLKFLDTRKVFFFN